MKFHRYAGVLEYKMAGWLVAHPYQQARRFWLDSGDEQTESAIMLDILSRHCSDHPSGKTLQYVLGFHALHGRPMQPSDIRGMPNWSGLDGPESSRSQLAQDWVSYTVQHIDHPGSEFRLLKCLLADMWDALDVMDIHPEKWPSLAYIGSSPIDEMEDVE